MMNHKMTVDASASLAPDRLADVEAIRQLTHAYSRAVDTSNLDELMDLFTDDAEWDTTAFGMGVVRGQADIREFFATLIENTSSRVHLALNHRIDVDGDSAYATVYLHAFVVHPDGRRDESVGYYADTYALSDRGWKIRRRAAHALLEPPPAPVQG